MHRSKVKNIYDNYRTEDNWANYKKQTNFWVDLLRKAKTEYFQKLNVKIYQTTENFGKPSNHFLVTKVWTPTN